MWPCIPQLYVLTSKKILKVLEEITRSTMYPNFDGRTDGQTNRLMDRQA